MSENRIIAFIFQSFDKIFYEIGVKHSKIVTFKAKTTRLLALCVKAQANSIDKGTTSKTKKERPPVKAIAPIIALSFQMFTLPPRTLHPRAAAVRHPAAG